MNMAEKTGIPTGSSAKPAEAVPERPNWLQGANGTSTRPSRGRRKQNAAPVVEPGDDEQPPTSWKTRMLLWLTSAAATGYGLSLIFHAAVLTGMGLWVLPGLIESNDITTVVESDREAPQEFDEVEELTIDAPAGNEEIVKPQHTEMIEQDTELSQLQHDFLADVTAAETEGEGGTTSGTGGGIRLLEPKNAVRKGSFTAWTIPIPQRFGEKPEAGDSPRPGQAYYIVIQVRVQEGRRTYKVNDLSGKVVGTDGYQQLIPAGAFVQEKNGKLTRAKLGRLLPIIDGVVQILIRVPGADSLVKDMVTVKSRSLKEQQTLELVFGK